MVDQATKEMRKRFLKVGLISLLVIAIISGGLIWWFFSAKVSLIAVRGDSMVPTLEDGQTVLLENSNKLKDGLIAVFPRPANWSDSDEAAPELIKRIIAVGDDTLSYDGEKLFVNDDEVLDLNATNYSCKLPAGYTHTLSSTEIFAMGDNHGVSLDSLRILCDGEVDQESAYVSVESLVAYGTIKGTF